MTFPFNAQRGLVVVYAELFGTLALDTGATATLINVAPLVTIGYDPALSPIRVQVTTGQRRGIRAARSSLPFKGSWAGAQRILRFEPYPAVQRDH